MQGGWSPHGIISVAASLDHPASIVKKNTILRDCDIDGEMSIHSKKELGINKGHEGETGLTSFKGNRL